MLLLAFDTATDAVTVAVHDGGRVLAETTTVSARRHGELLAPSIAGVLAEAGSGLDAVTATWQSEPAQVRTPDCVSG